MLTLLTVLSGSLCLCDAMNQIQRLFNPPLHVPLPQGLPNGRNSPQTVDTQNFTCTPGVASPECSYQGTCTIDGKNCICDPGYASTLNGMNKCDYEQKSPWVGFFLELFLGFDFGAGYFYLGLNGLGAGQLCLFFLGGIPVCVIMCTGMLKNDDVNMCAFGLAACYACLWFLGIIGWWIAAFVMIGQGLYLDANGMPVPAL
jgi:hypothetical protein